MMCKTWFNQGFVTTETLLSGRVFCLPGEAGKPSHLKEGDVTPTEGKTIRMARALLANGRV